MRNKPEFVLVNPSLNDNPRTKKIPTNLTPEKHLDNALRTAQGLNLRNILDVLLKREGFQNIVNATLSNNNVNLNNIVKGVIQFFEAKNMIKPEQPSYKPNDPKKGMHLK